MKVARAIPLHGREAVVRWGYYNAAAIGDFTANRQRDGRYRLKARVTMVDAYRLRQHPLTFTAEVTVAPKGKPIAMVAYVWPIHEFNVEGGILRALMGTPVGPPEW